MIRQKFRTDEALRHQSLNLLSLSSSHVIVYNTLLLICFLSSRLCVLSLVAKLSGFTYTPLSQNQPAQYCHLNDQGPLWVNFGKTTMTAAAGRSLLFNQHWRPASSIAKSNGAQRAFLCLARSGDGPAKTCKEI